MRRVPGASSGGVFLVAVGLLAMGLVLRRFLHLDGASEGSLCGWVDLSAERECVYRSIALEIETQASILGVSLNDAMEQRDSGKQEIAWRLVDLTDCEWDRLAQVDAGLLNALTKYMPVAHFPLPVRNIAAHHFKSSAMVNYARMHEVYQLVPRYKLRFKLHIRVLRRAVETLTAEFGRAYRRAVRVGDASDGIWNHLDLCFHDFDLITKEVLLALRAFLACLPDEELHDFATDLDALVAHGVRATYSAAR